MTGGASLGGSETGLWLRWKRELGQRRFLVEAVVTVMLFVITMRVCTEVMNIMEMRKGVSLPDPILLTFNPINLRWPIFIVLWTAVFGTIYHLAHYPRHFVLTLQAATVLLVFRSIALGLVPLEPAKSIIPLADPIVVHLGTGKLVLKDLFFSGHTAIVFLCALASRRRAWKAVCLAATVAVAVGVILQHVHYSADVFAAPFFAYGSWRIAFVTHGRLWVKGMTPPATLSP